MLFDLGEKVRIMRTGSTGEVVDRWFDGSTNRYYVQTARIIWSCSEAELDSEKALPRTSENQQVSGAKILKMPALRKSGRA